MDIIDDIYISATPRRASSKRQQFTSPPYDNVQLCLLILNRPV